MLGNQSNKLAGFLLMLLLTNACTTPRLEPRYDAGQVDYFQDLAAVPIVAVLRLGPRAPVQIGKPLLVPLLPDREVQLFDFSAHVENVLKGSINRDTAEVFYFLPAIPHGPIAKNMALYSTSDIRVLMLLRVDAGRLRPIADLSSCCYTAVYSGAHLAINVQQSKNLPETMINLLLNRGAGATDTDMVRAVFEKAPYAISPLYAERKLLELATADTPVVRTAACLEFRDLMAQAISREGNKRIPTLSKEFNVSAPTLQRWLAQYNQNGLASNWWAHGLYRGSIPKSSLPARSALEGMALCTNDNALRVPLLKTGPTLPHGRNTYKN